MRVFENIDVAIPEIRRDLSRSPIVPSPRVQHLTTEGGKMREAMGYGMTILPGGIPEHVSDVVGLLVAHFPLYQEEKIGGISRLTSWLLAQLSERLDPLNAMEMLATNPADLRHPFLGEQMQEGNTFAYLYGHRMVGAVETIAAALMQDKTTRRAFWPIYQSQDAMRMAAPTRIPCTLGYAFAIRETPGIGDQLHCTYLSRSCDFERFFLTDLYLASAFQQRVLCNLSPDISLGATSFFSLSLHRFESESEENF